MKHTDFIFDPKKKWETFDTAFCGEYAGKKEAEKDLKKGIKRLSKLQEKLYAQDNYSLLLIFQAMDAAGKDGTIQHVMSGINPQGCQVTSFKAPSAEELDHDFLWRCVKQLPERGRIGIFNRSYYEEVLIARVHPEIILNQKLPIKFKIQEENADFWKQRFEDINHFEKYLTRQGVVILKFFLNVSKEEQKLRFLDRIDNPSKNWKFSMGDVKEREYWDDYQHALEESLRHTSTDHAPWYVIPADKKWFMRAVVSDIICERLELLKLQFPKITTQMKAELQKAKEKLENETI